MNTQSTKLRQWALGALGVVIVVGFGLVVARSGPMAPTRVTVVKVQSGVVVPALFGIGTVEARRAYLIGPTVAGRVRSVAVDVGESVKAGQLLAEMDPIDLAERLAATEASMARASSAVAAAQAQTQDARARRALADNNARRYAELAEQRFFSPSAAEAKQQELASAVAIAAAADANLGAARQDLSRARAERDGLRQQQANLRLVAPHDGMVSARDAEAGSTVVAGQAVVRLIEPGSLWVKVRLDQARSAGLAGGLTARIVLRSSPSRPLAGKVVRVEPLSDSVTEERIAQIAFDALPDRVAVGELAEVTLKLPESGEAPLLPNAAIKGGGEQASVWQLANGDIRRVSVRLGQAGLDGQVQVLEGLKAGDEVIVHSERELAPGARIKVVDSLVGQGK